MPTAVAIRAARIGANGNGTPQLPMIPDSEKPPTPANVSWASDTWPAKPVTTTYDRPRMAAMSVPMTALRHVPCVTSSATTPSVVPAMVGTSSDRGRGARPSCWRSRRPRTGIPRPVTSRAPMITKRGTSSAKPLWGSHGCCPASVKASDWSMPMTMPAAAVGTISSK